MDLFTYDHEELARRVQDGLDRMTVNYLRAHGAQVHRDDLDFHGFEHVDLEVKFDNHHLIVRQTNRSTESSRSTAPPEADLVSTFESTFDGQPASAVSTGLIAQWLALLPAGEHQRRASKAPG